MRRVVSILLTVMLLVASLAGTGHEAGDPYAAETAPHLEMSDATAPSCCTGEVQRAAPSCHVPAALPPVSAGCVPARAAALIAFALGADDGDTLDPEGLLDPPRA